MRSGIGGQELLFIIGILVVLGVLGGILYAVTKGSGKGPGNDE